MAHFVYVTVGQKPRYIPAIYDPPAGFLPFLPLSRVIFETILPNLDHVSGSWQLLLFSSNDFEFISCSFVVYLFGASKVSENILDITRRQSFVNRNFSSFFLFLHSIHRLSFQLFVFYGVLNRESTRKIIFSAGDTSFLYFTVFLRIRWSDKIA